MKPLLFFSFISMFYGFVECRCENEARQKNTFLWSVKHPKRSSRGFLFGTIHVPYTEVWNEISDRVREAFDFSDTVLLEINLRDEATIRRLVRCKNLRRKQTARSYLPHRLYNRIENLMDLFRQSLVSWAQRQNSHNGEAFKRAEEIYNNIAGDWNRKRPEWLLFLLYQMCENVFERATSPMLDLYLAQKAAEEHKMVIAIETTEEQCNPLNSVSNDEVIFSIEYTVGYLENIYKRDRVFQTKKSRSITELVRHYKCGTLEEKVFDTTELSRADFNANLADRRKADMIDKKLKDDIIIQRNIRMANRLNSMLSGADNQIIFSAIGTGHFFGNKSVLTHLKDRGYIIEEISNDDIILPANQSDQKKKFTALWTRETALDSNSVTIELISSTSFSIENISVSTPIFLFSTTLLHLFQTL